MVGSHLAYMKSSSKGIGPFRWSSSCTMHFARDPGPTYNTFDTHIGDVVHGDKITNYNTINVFQGRQCVGQQHSSIDSGSYSGYSGGPSIAGEVAGAAFELTADVVGGLMMLPWVVLGGVSMGIIKSAPYALEGAKLAGRGVAFAAAQSLQLTDEASARLQLAAATRTHEYRALQYARIADGYLRTQELLEQRPDVVAVNLARRLGGITAKNTPISGTLGHVLAEETNTLVAPQIAQGMPPGDAILEALLAGDVSKQVPPTYGLGQVMDYSQIVPAPLDMNPSELNEDVAHILQGNGSIWNAIQHTLGRIYTVWGRASMPLNPLGIGVTEEGTPFALRPIVSTETHVPSLRQGREGFIVEVPKDGFRVEPNTVVLQPEEVGSLGEQLLDTLN